VAFDLLIKNHILSLPLIDPNTNQFYNFLDIFDIVHFTLKLIEDGTIGRDTDNVTETDIFQTTPCSQVVPFYVNSHGLMKNDNLSKAINTMVSLSHLQRLPVFDSQGNFEGIISQSKVVVFLADHVNKFPVKSKSLSELSGFKKVIKISEDSLLKDAFIKMKDEGTLGLAVVDSYGNLVGNISASDIKVIGIDAHLIQKLYRPISQVIGITQNKLKPITISPSTLIEEIFRVFKQEKVHRIYIEEDRGELEGVISLSDILSKLIEYC